MKRSEVTASGRRFLLGVAAFAVVACGGNTAAPVDDASAADVATDEGPTCTTPQTLCGSRCTDVTFDPSNCGNCDNVCPAASPCIHGVCAGTQVLCQPDGGAPYFADLQTDNANCGACGDACTGVDSCSSGHCCGAGMTYCGSACTNLQTDSANCGTCSNACGANASCFQGKCATYPKDCRDLLVAQGALDDAGEPIDGGSGKVADGEYVVDPDGAGPIKPFSVYCRGMNTWSPIEYLTLAHSSATGEPDSNFTAVATGGTCGITCSDLYREFTKVRIDPATLQVDSTDLTFALVRDSQSGTCWGTLSGACGSVWKTLPWGNGWDCACSGATGKANIDLRDTGFSIDPSVTFTPTGSNPSGGATFDTTRTVVDVTGGGCCGSNGPPALVQLKQL